jgi:hypothetical protein
VASLGAAVAVESRNDLLVDDWDGSSDIGSADKSEKQTVVL